MLSRKKTSSDDSTRPRVKPTSSSSGLTILELLIAFVLLQVAIVAFAQFMTTALNYSRDVRRRQMAQILAQTKMEELLRTIPTDVTLGFPSGTTGASHLLSERPGTFDDLETTHSEDVSPFRWIAETTPAAHNPDLLNLTLHVYVIKRRLKIEKATEPVEDFYLPEDRGWFTFAHTLGDGSVEVIRGQEKVSISSAVSVSRL
jgi:type II secretory pathway pseudopilin PulG